MRVSTLPDKVPGETEVGVVYASVEGVNDASYDECLHELKRKALVLGADAFIGMQLVQSQFQWNQRTSILATAIKSAAGTSTADTAAGAKKKSPPFPAG